MSQLTFKFVFNRLNKLDDKGTGLIQSRLTINKKSKYVSTGIRVKPDQWNSRKERVKNHNDTMSLNIHLNNLEERVLSAYRDDLANQNPINIDKLVNILKHGSEDIMTSNDFFRSVFKTKSLSRNTLKQHRVFLNYLDKFNPEIPFSQINYSFLIKFQEWLKLQDNYRGGRLSINYISSMLRILRIYTNDAIRYEKISVNPFLGFKIPVQPSKIVHLTFNEVEIIEKTDVSNRLGAIPETKSMFLFSCYTSLRFSDLCTLQVKHLMQTDEGLILNKKPLKTKKAPARHNVNLSKLFWGRPEQLIKPYMGGKKPENFVFGPHDQNTHNTSYNRHLDVIAELAGIDKKLTSHVARHTCAMVLLNEFNFSIEDVSTIMAHSDISITQKYARVRYDRLDRAIEEKFKADEQRH